MMQTINPHGPDRTAQIMSRYRPIAPRPDSLKPNSATDDGGAAAAADHSGIRKSPYLRTVWAHLQARPTRTRKRGRAASFSPPSLKRARTCLQGLIPPMAGNLAASWNFVPINCCLDTAVTTLAESVELPLLRDSPLIPAAVEDKEKEKEIDLNLSMASEEPDLKVRPAGVISPRPVRPVGSTVVVEGISSEIRRLPAAMGAEEVEEIVEAEVLPAIVSDSSNKVRMCNAAYKELVGQPECGWLERAGGGGACRRIGGGIWLRCNVERWLHGFSGWVRIEWERDGLKRCVRASCEALKLECAAKDYQFLWRFYGFKSGTEEDNGPSAGQ
ncbi:hypothetical protein STAS_16873 [Striga asiatica]|uniref:DUF7950 domain-containing protein n=1 Tax=Striga asiatica TaxID=4170 RepID=A0A5A7Q5I4_STRAF|nr:hypothetical protein STAS_16873 [Striga asiatica]